MLLMADDSLQDILGEPLDEVIGNSFVHLFMPEWQAVVATRMWIG